MDNKIFISYARDDQSAAQLIADRLSAAGFRVFFDVEAIVAGDTWSVHIRNALREAAAVLVLLSSNSRRSSYVKDELQTALESKKLVIPVLLDEEATNNWLWPLLATRQSISIDLKSPQLNEQVAHLVHDLRELREDVSPVFDKTAPITVRARAPRLIAWKIVVVAIVSAFIGGLATWLLLLR